MADGAEAKRAVRAANATNATSTRARLAVAGVALAFYALFILRTSFSIGGTRYFVLFEDAMISMRYARHLAAGDGLVWNVGEPPIEGFTNLLWVLWMSVAHTLGLSESKVSLFIMLTGVAILLATGLVVSKIARKIVDAPWVPVAVLAATLFDYPLVFWTLRGMEVGALALFVYTLLWLVLENEDEFSLPRSLLMGALTAGALLIRSDSVVPVGLICLYGFLTCSRRFVFAACIGAFAGTAVGGQTLFRKAYFHESLPNTYFLKLYKISALARIKRGAFVALEVLTMHLAVPVSIVLANLGFDRELLTRSGLEKIAKNKLLRRQVLLGTLFAAQIGYATYVGGDAWEWMLYANRYMCIGMPALIVLVAVVLSQVVASADKESSQLFARRLSIALVGCGLLLVALNVFAKKFPEQGIAATITFSKKAFAIGGALVFAGALLRLRDMREGIAQGLTALRRRVGKQHTVTAAALALMAIVWLPAHLLPFAQWATQNAAQYKDEANYTRLGILIRETTPPELRMAVAAAGATPYFAQRPTEDLLGKNDRHVAKLEPRGVFSPGHDKWDYQYSLGERKSDLIVETVDVNEADDAYISSLGFEKLENGMRLRTSAPVVHRDILGREMTDGATLFTALGELGKSLPAGLLGIDIVMVLAFGLVIGGAFRGIVRDHESFEDLSPIALEEEAPLDDSARAALKGAEARAIPTLDGMRGIAVLLVLMFHFAWTFPGDDGVPATTFIDKIATHVHAFLWSGWTGVDLFFVLSGYLITRGLVTPSKKPLGTRMKSFWMRRVLRIFPLYYAFIIVGTIIGLALGTGWIPGPSYWLYMQNYTLAFDDEVLRWTAHFWSLAIEEQFYFVWPIVALMVSRKKLIPTILVLVPAVVMLRGLLVFKGAQISAVADLLHDTNGIAKFVYRATFTRADGLLLGAFVAVTQREVSHPVSIAWRRLRFPIFVSTAVALAGLYVLAHGLNDYDRRIMGVGYVTLALFFASTISLCADEQIGEKTRAFLSWRPLVACGKVSYGMYIFHWPLVVLLVPRLEKMHVGMPVATQMALDTGVILGCIAIIYVVATISFRFFETPFLKLKGRFHD
ncbi:acyltransferase 3 [Labilithrix luteola]|uniref:Acyltransferase 3 n=1 Tax=Labilithrix luteola TaxID=1391654 RepID=A0A0K1Q1G7_9BACT|nr:acyltransferase [Labilithrix luteola]AKU99239.1 acyltransferase 3 [Labilithrix luteola]